MLCQTQANPNWHVDRSSFLVSYVAGSGMAGMWKLVALLSMWGVLKHDCVGGAQLLWSIMKQAAARAAGTGPSTVALKSGPAQCPSCLPLTCWPGSLSKCFGSICHLCKGMLALPAVTQSILGLWSGFYSATKMSPLRPLYRLEGFSFTSLPSCSPGGWGPVGRQVAVRPAAPSLGSIPALCCLGGSGPFSPSRLAVDALFPLWD